MPGPVVLCLLLSAAAFAFVAGYVLGWSRATRQADAFYRLHEGDR